MQTELNERIRLEGAEEAAAKLRGLSAASERLAKGWGALTQWGSALGGIGGIWAISSAIADTNKLYEAVARVKAVTGQAASETHAMLSMFDLAGGIGAESAERTILALSRLGSKMSGAGAQAQQTAAHLKRLGIAVKDGPEANLYQMADAAKLGKLGINDLIKAFNIPRGQASQMLDMLQGGSERLKKIKEDTLGGASLVTDAALAQHKQMLLIRRQLADAWGGLIGTLYKNLLPAVTLVLTEITNAFKALEPVTSRVGAFLAEHMRIVVGLAKTYLALMLAAKAANVFAPGPALGLLGRSKQIGMGAMGLLTPTSIGRKFTPSGGVTRMYTTGLGGTFGEGSVIFRILASTIGRIGVLGAVIGVLVGAFILLKNNALGIRDALASTFGGIFESIKNSVMNLLAVFAKLFEIIKPVLAILGGVLLGALWVVAKALQGIAWVIERVTEAIAGVVNLVIWAYNKLRSTGLLGLSGLLSGDMAYIDLNDRKRATAAADARDVKGKEATIYQDFRGSQFNIENNFPEGVDGGRVAVAFGDEMAALGERRLDSGLRPLYSYR